MKIMNEETVTVTAEVRTSTYYVFQWVKKFYENLESAYIPLPVHTAGSCSMQIRSQYITLSSTDFYGRLRLYAALYPDILGPDFAPLWKATEKTPFRDRELSHLELSELYRWIDENYLGNEWITLRFASDREDIGVEIGGITRYFGYSDCNPQNDGAGIQEA